MTNKDTVLAIFNKWYIDVINDDDLIKANKIYKLCLKNTEKMNKLFTPTELEALSTLLQDY